MPNAVEFSDPEARRPLDVLGSRLEALSVIYRKLYLDDHRPEVDFGAYLEELFDELFAFHGVDPPGDRALDAVSGTAPGFG